jgi:hypothetical protein
MPSTIRNLNEQRLETIENPVRGNRTTILHSVRTSNGTYTSSSLTCRPERKAVEN